MATDPVQSIRAESFASELDSDVVDPLHDIAALPHTPETPYLTVTLNWTPSFDDPGRLPADELRRSEERNRPASDPTSRRPARTWLEKELKALVEGTGQRSPERAHLEADIAQVLGWLDGELDPAAGGVYIVSSQAQGVFVPLALAVTMPDSVSWGPQPAIETLAHVAEDYATYAILVADQERAELSFVTQGTRGQGVTLTSTLYPRKQAQGGPNQRRYQARADQRVFHFARAVAGEAEKAFREVETSTLVLVGSRVFIDELKKQFSAPVTARIAGEVAMDLKPEPTGQQLIDATAGIALAAERAREARAVDEVREILGQGQAVAGTIDVLNALQARQVMKLVMNEDYAATGWADFSLPLFGIGEIPAEHPTGGDPANLVTVNLVEEFIRLDLAADGHLEMVHVDVPFDGGSDDPGSRTGGDLPRSAAAMALDDVGGVAALLRYAQ